MEEGGFWELEGEKSQTLGLKEATFVKCLLLVVNGDFGYMSQPCNCAFLCSSPDTIR